MTTSWTGTSHDILEWYKHNFNYASNYSDDKSAQALFNVRGDRNKRLAQEGGKKPQDLARYELRFRERLDEPDLKN